MIKKIFLTIIVISLFTVSCTKLKENLNGQVSVTQIAGGGAGNTALLLSGIYENIRGTFQDQAGVYALWEMLLALAIKELMHQ